MYKGLIGVERKVLDSKEAEIFIQMSTLDMQDGVPEEAHQGLMANSLGYKIMVDRLTRAGSIEFISRPLMFFLATVIDRPGTAVLWAYTLNWMATQSDRVGIAEWAMQFPDGLPTEPGMHAAWEAQKLQSMGIEYKFPESDNWIDNIDNWPKREKAMVREATPEELGECNDQCKSARCAMGDEAYNAQIAEMMETYGWYAHFVPDDPDLPVNAHTHGVTKSFSHPNFQIVLPIKSEIAHGIFTQLVAMVKSGYELKAGMRYTGVIQDGYEVTFINATECDRDVLRLIIPDAEKHLDEDDMDEVYARQYD